MAVEIWPVPRLDETKWGLWCPRCLKCSGYEAPIDYISTFGVSRSSMVARLCFDCNTPLPVERDI